MATCWLNSDTLMRLTHPSEMATCLARSGLNAGIQFMAKRVRAPSRQKLDEHEDGAAQRSGDEDPCRALGLLRLELGEGAHAGEHDQGRCEK